MAKIKDLDGRVENRVRQRARKRGKEGGGGWRKTARKEIRGGDSARKNRRLDNIVG